jgi:hypothetical protein
MNDFYEYIEKLGITPNAFFVLWSIKVSRRTNILNPWGELRLLKIAELIDDQYKISTKGQDVLVEGEQLLCNGSMPKKKPGPVIAHLEENAVKYLLLFPAGKLPSGKAARVNIKDIIKAFVWFFNNYDYSWETILTATAYYIDTYEQNKFMYMKNSQYFIRKQITGVNFESDLASYCEIILNGGYDESGNQIIEKVV